MSHFFKKTALCAIIAASVTACGGSDGSETEQQGLNKNLEATGSISSVGDVDWFEYNVTQANEIVNINVRSNVLRADVELLATAYEKDSDGNLVRLYAEHAGVNSATTANLNLNLLIKEPKTIYVSVRDLKDDAADGFDYRVSIDVSNSNDQTSSFEDALSLNQTCQSDVIGAPNDVDAFSFIVSEKGVYSFITDFQQTSDKVHLAIKLYNEDGTLVESLSEPTSQGTLYPMVHFLNPGTYYAMVADDGRNGIKFDSASPYTLCAAKIDSDEVGTNDTQDGAEAVALAASETAINGSLDYNKDADWYELSLPAKQDGDFQVLDINFDASSAQGYYEYEVTVVDANGVEIMTHIQNSASQSYNSQLKVSGDNAPYYLVITPVGGKIYTASNADDDSYVSSAPYEARVSVIEVDDLDDVAGNDTPETATELASGVEATGKIAYRTDNDWYQITVPNQTDYQVLEVFLETDQAGAVEYSLAVVGAKVEKTVEDLLGSDGITILKTSLVIPKNPDGTGTTYFLRVRDFQDDDSNAESGYRIMARTFSIPDDFASSTDQPAAAIYHDEKTEQDNLNDLSNDQKVLLEVEETIFDRQFSPDTSTLVFEGDNANPAFSKVVTDGTTIFTSPWIGGYVDYQGDQDWFKLNLQALTATQVKLDEEGNAMLDGEGNELLVADSNWYYDLKVEMLSAGSEVEYVWKLHYDKNGNQAVYDFPSSTGDGVSASNGDTTSAQEAINLITGDDEEFWRNEQLKGVYYLKVADFNIVDASKVYTQYQDYDWSYDEPYYLRLTLTYHSGLSRAQ